MPQLSDEEHNALMADMKSFDKQMPCVGSFSYDPEKHAFFGVQKKEITPREIEELAKRGVFLIKHPERIESKPGLCGGCVVWNKDKFTVLVGKWTESVQEELTVFVEAEFSLPYFEFVYDEHLDLDHGYKG